MKTYERAFSLVELLAVVAIMSVLLVLIIPGVSSVLQANRIATAVQVISGEMEMARQLAAARNRTIEVRFIKKNDQFSAIQLWWSDGVPSAAGKAVALSSPLAILSEHSMSPILGAAGMFQGTMPSGGTFGGNSYKAFRIRASGMIEPPPTATNKADFYFTIASDSTPQGVVPANYATVQINPDTGRVMIYRP